MKRSIATIAMVLIAALARAVEPAVITEHGNTWTLRNETLQATVAFSAGNLSLTSFSNRQAKRDYLKGRSPAPLFSFVIDGKSIAANDGGWRLAKANVSDIELYGIKWGKRLEITLTRTQPVAFSIRQVFEIYDGRAGLRCTSYLRNETDREQTIESSDVLSLNFPDQPHELCVRRARVHLARDDRRPEPWRAQRHRALRFGRWLVLRPRKQLGYFAD